LPQRHRRPRQDRRAHQGIRGPLPVALHRGGARLHRRGHHAALDKKADRASAGDAEGQEGGSAGEEARQSAVVGVIPREYYGQNRMVLLNGLIYIGAMTDTLKKLIEAAKTANPSPEHREEQRRSF